MSSDAMSVESMLILRCCFCWNAVKGTTDTTETRFFRFRFF